MLEETTETKSDFDRLVHRMNRAYGCFWIWKNIRKSLSIPEIGEKEAERRSSIMSRYGGIFSGVLYATENTFITDLHKFFDKPKKSLRLESLIGKLSLEDRKKIDVYLNTHKNEIKRIENLRHNFTAHEPINPQDEKIYTQEIEAVFLVIQEILNIISKSTRGDFFTWELWESTTNESFTCLLNDLESAPGYLT